MLEIASLTGSVPLALPVPRSTAWSTTHTLPLAPQGGASNASTARGFGAADVTSPAAQALSTQALSAVLDEIDYGVMVVEAPTGRLLHANSRAHDECRRFGSLDLHGGVATMTDAIGQRAFVNALFLATQGRRSLLTLNAARSASNAHPSNDGTDSEAPAATVAVVPLPGDGSSAQALLLFGKRQVADALNVGFFARLFGLTPTEESVLLCLCRSMKPTEIADEHGVAISTVRTHVNSIRLKTGTGSIRDLVHKVSTLPPMASALRAGTH